MANALTRFFRSFAEMNRASAFSQARYAKQTRAELDKEYAALFGDKPVMERYCKVRLDNEKITGTLINVHKEADGSLHGKIRVDANNARQGSYESNSYATDRYYTVPLERLTKIADAPEEPEIVSDNDEKYALEEYANKYGLKL